VHPQTPAQPQLVVGGEPLRGDVAVPGDKSVSHRAVLLNALAHGRAEIRGLATGHDVRATAAACRALGAEVSLGDGVATVAGSGALTEPETPLDCGNSGTTLRLLLGALAGFDGHAVLIGDDSLSRRPMLRVVAPLRAMGAAIDGRQGGRFAPLAIRGRGLSGCDHDLAIASAQVKSALLLAGLRCGVRVREPRTSRDHTERMLRSMGARLVTEAGGWLALQPSALEARDVSVPGDLSAAAFLLVAGAVVPGSEVRIRGVGVNPTRTGVLDVLRAMGAAIEVAPAATAPDPTTASAEPIADVTVRHGPLRGTEIGGELALRSLDELVVLSVAAAFASGTTTIRDAAELRVKESDRIARVAAGLRAAGVRVEERPDGLVVEGVGPGGLVEGPGPARVDATGDHRIAMAFAVLGLAAPGGVILDGADSVTSSWPEFFEVLGALQGRPRR
jgi:3-phosphoshikimate 1-carboxyvinyltransferase